MRKQIENNSLALGFILLYLIFTFVWYSFTESPWDDDCITRYFKTKAAFSNPENFIGLWNRPLFVILFSIPFQISKHTILLMALLTAFSSFYLFKSLKIQGIKNAYLVIPLFLFQSYFFTISRSSLAEPLAAIIFCFGYYFYINKRYLLFAIIGSLLPIARLELSVVLPIWAFLLFKNKEWKYIPILGIPLLLWSFGGLIIQGDGLVIFNKTLGKETVENRYGHKSFFHYFRRYIYFTGPIIFYFFVVGIFESIYKKKVTVFITVQFLLAFFLYVVFSWKLSLGQAAGFLRHLATLAPFVAIFALIGYNGWLELLTKTNAENISRSIFDRIRYLVYSLIIIVVVYFFMCVEIEDHHKLLEIKNYSNLYIVGTIFIVMLILSLYKFGIKHKFILILNILFGFSLLSFTLYTEKPDIHFSPERKAMTKVTNLIANSYFNKNDIYVNHNWFHWINGSEPNDKKYKKITKANLIAAPDSSIIVWESHYSTKHIGDVEQSFLISNSNYVILYGIYTSDKKFAVIIYQKINSGTPEGKIELFNKLVNINNRDENAYFFRGNYYDFPLNNKEAALQDFNKTIELNPNFADAYYNKGVLFTKDFNYKEAIPLFKKTLALDPLNFQAMYNLGACYTNTKELGTAIKFYNKAIKVKSDYALAYYGKALVYESLNEYKSAITQFTKYIKLKPQDNLAYFKRAILLSKTGKEEMACKDLEIAKKLGHLNAGKVLEMYCK